MDRPDGHLRALEIIEIEITAVSVEDRIRLRRSRELVPVSSWGGLDRQRFCLGVHAHWCPNRVFSLEKFEKGDRVSRGGWGDTRRGDRLEAVYVFTCFWSGVYSLCCIQLLVEYKVSGGRGSVKVATEGLVLKDATSVME